MALDNSLLSVGRMAVEPSWAAARHSHPFVEMMVINGGALDVRLADGVHRAAVGDVLLYPPGTPHDERVAGGVGADFTFFAFRGSPLGARAVVHDGDGRLRVLAAWLMQERDAATVLRDAILALMIAEYERLCAHRASTLADRVRTFLREHIAEPLSVEDIARSASMSRAHFIRTFKRESGSTPMAALRRLRVEAARDLIITTDLPLKAIADRVGLGDEYHLSHVFRRELRVSPGYFRKKG
ncbi:MAG: helix-turn-helix transcriptional regulator [Planctomycetes bacterium]|nr:helix-turn-helix transcriptional regulator [Planctomycetota bacterium]